MMYLLLYKLVSKLIRVYRYSTIRILTMYFINFKKIPAVNFLIWVVQCIF